MRGLCQSIGVVTASEDGQWVGMTASSITSVSMDPPSVLVCVNRGASIHSAISRSRRFNVNYLAEGHEELSRLFSSPISNEERFLHGSWSAQADNPPELDGALSVLSCELEHASSVATHTIFVGRVQTVTVAPRRLPLVYLNRRYHPLRDARGLACV